MKKTPDINPESQDVAELQAMVKALMASENQWKQERQSLLEQLKLAFDRQFEKRSEALKPYDESQGDLFNEVECEAAKEEEVEVTTTTTKKRGKRKPLPKTLPREVIELDLDDHEKQCACCQHSLHKIGEDRTEKLVLTSCAQSAGICSSLREGIPCLLGAMDHDTGPHGCVVHRQLRVKSHILRIYSAKILEQVCLFFVILGINTLQHRPIIIVRDHYFCQTVLLVSVVCHTPWPI